MTQDRNDIWNKELERVVRDSLQSMRFCTVTLVVLDGRVNQVDKNVKIRFIRSGHIDGSGI